MNAHDIQVKSRINLHQLILLLALFFVSLTFISVLYASYQEQKQLLLKNSSAADTFYAFMLAEITGNMIKAIQHQLDYQNQNIDEHIHDPVKLNTTIISIHRSLRILNAVQFVNAEGKVLASSSFQDKLPDDYADAEFSKTIRQQKTAAVFTTSIDSLHLEALNITQPLFSDQGKYLGYLDGIIYLQKDSVFYQTLINKHVKVNIKIYLIDQHRRILNFIDPAQLGKFMNASPVTAAVLNNQSGTAETKDTRGHLLIAYAPVSSLGWGIIIERPIDTALTILYPLILSTAIKTIPLLLISLMAIWFFSKRIARPLWKLATQARSLDNHHSKAAIEKIHAWYFEAAQLKESILLGMKRVDHKIDRLDRESLTDPLTGLINRRGMERAIEAWNNMPFAVLFVDIDHFKLINDQYGHDVGDAVLQAIAGQMRLNFRPNDLLCRIGGEEFVLFLPLFKLDEAFHAAERFRLSTAHHLFREIGHITISIGVAYTDGTTSVDDLIKMADKALYQAKTAGRNQTVIMESEEWKKTA